MYLKGLCFICRGPDHSCLSDTEEMTEVEQVEIPSYLQGKDSYLDESMGSYEDASEEHESCRVVDSRTNSYDEKSVDPMGDIRDDGSPVMIQREQHMVEHESA